MDNRRAMQALCLFCCLTLMAASAWGHRGLRGRPKPQTPAQERARQLVNMGMTHLWQTDYPQAIMAFQEATQLVPKTADAYCFWGFALGSLGQHEEEIEKYALAVRYDPTLGEAYAAWAVALSQLGRKDEAKAKVKEALAVGRGILGPIELLSLKVLGLLD